MLNLSDVRTAPLNGMFRKTVLIRAEYERYVEMKVFGGLVEAS